MEDDGLCNLERKYQCKSGRYNAINGIRFCYMLLTKFLKSRAEIVFY